MFSAIIIEDEINAANMLENMIAEINPAIRILDKCKDLPSGVKSIRKNGPALVFLDIELPVYSGLRLLEFFSPEEINFKIIFTTAYNQYAINAFEMSAIDYLLKPIQAERLSCAIEKLQKYSVKKDSDFLPVLQQNLQQHMPKKIVVSVANGFEILKLADICYFKAAGSYTQIYFSGGSNMLVSKNLKHFETMLSGMEYFIRIHRGFIANIHFAIKILRKDGGLLVLEKSIELPVSEDKMEHVITIINKL